MTSTNADNATSNGVDIEAWTQGHLAERMASVSISPSVVTPSVAAGLPVRPGSPFQSIRGVSSSLVIPLDDHGNATVADIATGAEERERVYRPRLKPRRDSLVRREALLKGKEGSRRRQKWENDRLLGNPWAEPPEPRDWEVRPTYPVHKVPYILAPLWDGDEKRSTSAALYSRRKAARDVQDIEARQKRRNEQRAGVPRELRDRLRRSRGAKGLLMDLEEQVRDFVKLWDDKAAQLQRQSEQKQARQKSSAIGSDSEDDSADNDEEIVFVGRGGRMNDVPSSPISTRARADSDDWERIDPASPMRRAQQDKQDRQLKRDRLIFDSLVDDHGASFGRWLVHTIAAYYNLKTWSVTVGEPERREAYVGIDEKSMPLAGAGLPRPLWGLV